MNESGNNSSNQSIGALLQNLSQFCRSDYLSEKGLREIIGLHGFRFAPNNDPNIKSYKFFRSACHNERVTESILRYLLKYFPGAVRAVGEEGELPLHVICFNKNITLGMLKLLIDAFPDSLRHEDNEGLMPLHALCDNRDLNEEVGLEILKLLLERCPESVRHAARDGCLSIHLAAAWQSPEFCRLLIEAYPGSERKTNHHGTLPFHAACHDGTVATAKYLYQLFPESINVANNNGAYPIHCAIRGLKRRRNLKEGIEVVKFLENCNPDLLSSTGKTSLHLACGSKYVTLKIVQLLIDAFPDSVCHEDNKGHMLLHELCVNINLDDEIGLEILKLLVERCPESVRHAARDGDGVLPIHIAAAFQSPEFCRLLIEAYPGSERMANDNFGMLPFHLACQYNTLATAKYLYRLYPESINVADNDGEHPIHYAIMGINNRSNLKEGIKVVKFLLECNPDVLGATGQTPLHFACCSDVTLKTVRLLNGAFPDSVRHQDNKGSMPLHELCRNKILDEEIKVKILKLLVERCPVALKHATRNGNLPIHIAATHQSPEFCRILIEAYPGSERLTSSNGLPFHVACLFNAVDTAKYLYALHPESINVADNDGWYPIYYAIKGIHYRDTIPETAIELVQFLLDCNPGVVLQKLRDDLPLYFVCEEASAVNDNTSKLNVFLKVLQILYDVHPEAIESNEVTSSVGEFCEEVQTFINAHLTYARQARDQTVMTTPDEDGQLPLHRALRDNVTISLGSMKLLIKGNPSAICTFDNRGMIPVHVACQHHETPAVVEYLIGLNKITLTLADWEGNTVLHHACRGANHAIIALLLDKYGSMSVSKRNAQGQLPIDLLLRNKDGKSVKFTESIYRLIRANPETLMHYDLGQTCSKDCQNRKKRKIDEV